MASWYVRSGAAGTASGADWTNAKLTLAAAITASAAGDTFYVSEDHAETQAVALTLTFKGTSANPDTIYCVNHSGSVPPVSADLRTTATVTTTGNSGITINGRFYSYGIIWSAGTGANAVNLILSNTGANTQVYEASALQLGGSTGGAIYAGGGGSQCKVVWKNSTAQFSSTASTINVWGRFVWQGTTSAITGATIPSPLITQTSALPGDSYIEGVDLSAAGSGKTLVSPGDGDCIIKDCKLGASVTISSTPTAQGAGRVYVIRSDSGATNYRTEKYDYTGIQSVETTIIRTGGATDGTTVISDKIVTTANSKWVLPFEVIPITFWNDSTSAITTLTLYGTTTGGGVPKDDEIWFDVEYLGSALTPQSSILTTSKADGLAASAATNNSADGSTWAGGGAGNGFKIVSPSFTPGQKGPITIYVRVAKVSSTYYIDPKPTISGVTVSKSFILAPGVYANELSAGGSSIGISTVTANMSDSRLMLPY